MSIRRAAWCTCRVCTFGSLLRVLGLLTLAMLGLVLVSVVLGLFFAPIAHWLRVPWR